MACRFEDDTECCAVCGAAFERFAAAGGRCRYLGRGVVHLDRARARRQVVALQPLLRELAREAVRLTRRGPGGDATLVWDAYAHDEGPG